MDQITNRIYLGSWKDCSDVLNNPEWDIVSVAVDAQVKGPNWFPITDGGRAEKDLELFKAAVHKVLSLLFDGRKNVLVHCQSGVNRSTSVVLAALLFLNRNLSLKEAYELVRSRRPRIDPFEQQLMNVCLAVGRDWEKEKFKPTIVVLSETEESVNTLYKEVLGRAADPDGLKYYGMKVQSGMPLDKLREVLMCSDEYKRKQVNARL